MKDWNKYVSDAKKWRTLHNYARIKMADIAINICAKNEKGIWQESNSPEVLRKFASAVGIKHQTLELWMKLKRQIIMVIGEPEIDDPDYYSVRQTEERREQLTADKTIRTIYSQEKSRDHQNNIIAQHTDSLLVCLELLRETENVGKYSLNTLRRLQEIANLVQKEIEIHKEIK